MAMIAGPIPVRVPKGHSNWVASCRGAFNRVQGFRGIGASGLSGFSRPELICLGF